LKQTKELIDRLKKIDTKKEELAKEEEAIIASLKNGSGGTHPNPNYP